MVDATYNIQQLQELTGVQARTLRHWIRRRLLPKPNGRGRGARYTSIHVLRARVIRQLRATRAPLNAIRTRIAALSEEQLSALIQPVAQQKRADGVPEPPPSPNYPSTLWEVVILMDGLALMVNPERGPALRRIANEIYRYYAAPPRTAQ